VSRSAASVIEVTSEFGSAFPPVACTVRVVVIDNSTSAALVYKSDNVFIAPSGTTEVSAFTVPDSVTAAPFTGNQDVCTIIATLLPAANPPNAPDASFLTSTFMLIP
jgi:hypothetical protein